jgi:putative oxidoreductase
VTLRQVHHKRELIIGRSLLGSLFLICSNQKVANPDPAMQLLVDRELPDLIIVPAANFNLSAGICVILNLHLRPVCRELAVSWIVTSLFHFIPNDGWKMSIFVKNCVIAGGFLYVSSMDHTRNSAAAARE